jgi:4-diphosphocytidyl-2-C-methyl-D-erythritol kinase
MPEKRPAATVRVEIPAYAKINLYLDVLGCREDGFHDLLSVMHAISLHDDIILYYTPAPICDITLRIFGSRLPTDRRNLVYRAAEAFLEKTGLFARIHITIRKRLPIAAGMAGGSSDAAATLRALNEAAGKPLAEEELLSLGATLGSDIPFCLTGGTQICRGRGEQMHPLTLKEPLHLLVVWGREHISTPRAFAAMDEYYHRFDGSVPHGTAPERLFDVLERGSIADTPALLYNAFEPVVLPACPEAAAAKEKLLSLGAYAAFMSGSGPSVFGLFRTREDATRAATAIGPRVRALTSAPPVVIRRTELPLRPQKMQK